MEGRTSDGLMGDPVWVKVPPFTLLHSGSAFQPTTEPDVWTRRRGRSDHGLRLIGLMLSLTGKLTEGARLDSPAT